MATTKFTPGPWQFYELPGGDGLGYIRPDPEDSKEIAHHGDSDRSRDENVANAHLSAAAPEMCAALELAETFIAAELECRQSSFLPDPKEHEKAYLDEAEGALTAVRSALAKAVR